MNWIRKVLKEFKDFAVKGDAITLAVGVLIGTAFKTVIDSFVKDIVLPPINFFTQRVDFTTLYFVLGRKQYSSLSEAEEAGAIVIKYGNFITELIVFLITAFAIFLFVYKFQQMLNRKAQDEKKVSPTKKCKYCQMEVSAKATKCPHCTSTLS
jgi:large conductance mechanosensitive channel